MDDLGVSLSWRDLWVLVMRWQRTPGTALCEAVHGERWTTEAQLLATVIDVLELANWQRIGKKTAPKPKRFPRPWEKAQGQKLGRDPIPVSEFDAWWDAQSAGTAR